MNPSSPNLLMLGITGNLAFAAGALLLSFRRHSPDLDADVLVYTDGTVAEHDARLLGALGAQLVPYRPETLPLSADYLDRFSLLTLARLEALPLLDRYAAIVWLDVDTAIQHDISALFTSFGPFSLALADPNFYPDGKNGKARVNVVQDIPHLDPHAPNYNAGVFVVTRGLNGAPGNMPGNMQGNAPGSRATDAPGSTPGNWHKLYKMCFGWLKHYGPSFRFADQGVLNMLAQHLQKTAPALFTPLPHDLYNTHPRNPNAAFAPLVHCFGPYNIWSDGRMQCVFPEWTRDYRRWLDLGGSPYSGEIRYADFCPKGPMELLGLASTAGQARGLNSE